MAVYTEVTDEELGAFLSNYEVGGLLSFKGIAEGVENSNFLVHTETGNFVLTLYEKRVNPGDLPFFLGLMTHLAAAGAHCPTPIKTRTGNTLGTLSGRPAAMVSFLDGIWIRRPQPRHCIQLGQAMAELHVMARDFPMGRQNSLSLEGWHGLFADVAPRADEVAAGLARELETELAFLDRAWPHDLPQGIIHADLFPDNVFFIQDQLSGLIDFYFACTDTLAYDLAITLNAWCFEADGAFNITKARALLTGYAQKRPLEAAELAALPILARGSAVRFLLTRLYDWLNHVDGTFVKPKNPLDYLHRLRFHRDVTGPGAYGLDG